MRSTAGILIGLLLGTACQSSTEPYAAARVVTRVAASGNAAAPLTISTTITNDSRRALTFSANLCPRRFRVETLTGVVISLGDQICTLDARSATLPPGAQYQYDEQWSGKDADGVALIGTYRVIGQPFLTAGPQSAPVTFELPR